MSDLSDRGLVERFGDVMFEIPELFEALRRFELERRPIVTSGGVRVHGHGISMQRIGGKTRCRIGNSGSIK